MNMVTKVFEIETSPDVMDRIERFFALLHYNSLHGHSGIFAMPLDGDGASKVIVSPKPDFRKEVELCASIGGGVEIAQNGGYSVKNIVDMNSNFIVRTCAVLFKNGTIHKAKDVYGLRWENE